ncbi:MAG: M1 family aminopeptidase [Bacteroidota bacterium]
MRCSYLSILLSLMFIMYSSAEENYWQQYVHYSIKATLNTNSHKIGGSETLVYTNNSPDTLRTVYFRLYWNLFTERSHGYNIARRHKQYHFSTSGGISLRKFSIVTGGQENPLVYKIDDTILRADLPNPLNPGDELSFSIEWTENVPVEGWRTGHQGRDYNIAQWYPQIAVYDKYGWHTDQYTGEGEFHDDYGTFDVEITLPKSFILGYTGTLLNPTEVLPDTVQRKLKEAEGKAETTRIADFSDRAISKEDTASVLTWKFHAENVRDFAWTANEHYIWDVSHWGDVTIHSLYFADKAQFWKDVADYGRHAIDFFSQHFGRYVYPNAFVVEGVIGGGMEYPGIVFIGHIGDRNSHGLFGVVTHELGHEWYPMMISSNETEFAFQDEGFNTFITTLAQEDYYGRHNNSYTWTEWWQKLLHYPNADVRTQNMMEYLILSKIGYEEPVATHSDRFEEPALSGISVYPKTATVMFMLQYVLGDSVFSRLMMEYYNRWRFKHPYPEDFFSLAQEASGNRDLRWFFDEWFNRTYQCDYSLRRISSDEVVQDGKKIYRTTVTVKRLGQAIMPIDVRLDLKDGSKTTLYIPVDTWKNGVVEYEGEIDLPSEPRRGEINPDRRIADVNRLNNTYPWPRFDFRFENTMFTVYNPFEYVVQWRPSFWYNAVDGVKLGAKLSGRYLDDLRQFTAWSWIGTGTRRVDFDVSCRTELPWLTPLATFGWRGFRIEGRQGFSLSFTKQLRHHYSYPPYHTFEFGFSHLTLKESDYLLQPWTWESGLLNRVFFNYAYENRGEFWETYARFNYEASVSIRAQSRFNYSKRTFDVRLFYHLPEDWRLALRIYNGRASGTIPIQTQYFFSSGSPMDQFSNPFFRSRGMLPATVRDHALYQGDGNLRGFYNQYLYGDKIDAANIEVRLPGLIPFINNVGSPFLDHLITLVRTVGFIDIGRIAFQDEDFSRKRVLVDLGFGFRINMPISSTSLFQSIGLTTLRLDFPLYVNNAAPGESRTKFRWVIGLSETF